MGILEITAVVVLVLALAAAGVLITVGRVVDGLELDPESADDEDPLVPALLELR